MTGAVLLAGADAASLLSGWWSRPVPGELESWAEGWPHARDVGGRLGADPDMLADVAGALAGSSTDDLLEEYERLFVGPGRTPCPPYESLWLSGQPKLEQGRLMGAASTAVADLYRRLGLDVAASAHELPDHLAIEWEALAYAWRRGDEVSAGVAAALLDEHLRAWVPAFCAAVREAARGGFYAQLATLTDGWLERLIDGWPAVL